MTSDTDIYRSANVLIQQHGPDAKVFAAMQADACAAAGDMDGRAAWLRIITAIGELQDASPPPSTPRH